MPVFYLTSSSLVFCGSLSAIMNELSNLLNCSVHKDTHYNMSTYNFTNSSIECAPIEATKAAGLGTITGFLIALFLNTILSIEYDKLGNLSLKIKLNEALNSKTLSRIIAMTILVLVLPVITIFLLFALFYKVLCSVIIKRKDKQFAGFLDSFDVFWSLEDVNKSVINVVGVIETDSPQIVVNNIKKKLQNIFPYDNGGKIFYRRREDFGFYYWRRCSFIDLDQYVQIVEFPNIPDKINELCLADLEELMTEISNQSLPYNDEGLFKILITKQRIGNYDKERGEYGIVFKIHHSVGDGVALIDFLCRTLADKVDDCPINIFSTPDAFNVRDYSSPIYLLDMIKKLCEIPLCFVDGIIRKSDSNSLHGQSLKGRTAFKWTESDENLLLMVREIKNNVEHLKFSDVLATALCNGLKIFFMKTMAHVPEDVAVVLPVRFPKSSAVDDNLRLLNDFSVTILDLPIKGDNNIENVKKRCDQLRTSADALTNYYFLKLVCSVLPKQILQPLLNSSQATMVFSNMPGPEYLSICGGNALKRLVFFVPHKGITGVGVTALCYGGVLRFAVSADVALVSNPEDLTAILDGMEAEIKRLHRHYVAK